ncbi:ATP-dependent RNA helicase HrpA [Catenuloplanes indicus]|uniref:RNA helicase n=1 Tax=Catenuloplanes indicus TaxID=137267 RepID=A0AAE3VYV9_9ACTN|nr:ATP-dependent RNA helicase HrpA [Catenuloplanes indicus]MDQ0366147.1 ATP-dependent helicase HrpA [Catenuloplanes indicus]
MQTNPAAALAQRLPHLMLRDERRLRRRLDGVRKVRDPESRAKVLANITAEVETAEARIAARAESRPEITYPEQLPVSALRDEIRDAIRDHQVVIVAGETGSGKTTQLPKICMELGRGVRGLIGHTQPRRLAARTVAERIAEELKTGLGQTVGFKVRFTDQVSDASMVKLMTDGILLAEIQNDRNLTQYDTLIIDEAHERSLNIDFILGYLKQLLPRRPDLKIVITSATIDPERFAAHFADAAGKPAPIVEVSGRTFPVEVRYRPVVDPDDEDSDPDRDQTTAILDAVRELQGEGPGDILVFLSGEREIRDTADALTKAEFKNTEILPLYARLSVAEQHRVFAPHPGRRVVLATNVAETSLTVPGIKYVIDPGTARISRYSHRLKVQRLPIEPVSQASANQRKGRCGRVSEGICIRLYTEEDFLSRPEFTDPEILRTNLASVILQMTALGLGDLAAFPFVEPPDKRNVKDGVNLLEELGALDPVTFDPAKRLTPLGRRLAALPVDPRLARMVLEAEKNGVVHEVMVIAAALSIQDPRERPQDAQQQAQQQHARFTDKDSDFLTYWNLWRYLRDKQKELSSSAFRRMCRKEYLNYLRVREWQDIYAQLREAMGVPRGALDAEGLDSQKVHTSLLTGLLSQIGLKDVEKQQEYVGARNARFVLSPGSALFKKSPRWVMAAELVETNRLWARVAAKIEPEWVEPLAAHLVKRSYSEPHWEKKQGAVMAMEKVTLYGVPLVAQRKVNYGRIDPELSRELFIRHALVEGDWQTHHKFFHANRRLIEDVEELEQKTRRRDIVVDDETLFSLYDARIPADVVSGRHFDSWWKKESRTNPSLLTFDRQMLINAGAGGVDEADYPDEWEVDGLTLPLTYQFEPGTEADGVTVRIPLPVLNQVPVDAFDWQVPGLREELVTALIRGLPKNLRRNFVPVPDHARAVLDRVGPGDGPLLETLERELRRITGVLVPPDAWEVAKLPDHLRMTFRIVDEKGKTVGEGKDLLALRSRLRPRTQQVLAASAATVERTGLTTWDVGTVPKTFQKESRGYVVRAFPALVDEGDTVGLRLFDTEAEQLRAMWAGNRRLLLLALPAPAKFVADMPNSTKLALARSPHGSFAALLDDIMACAVDKAMADFGGPAWDAAAFTTLLTKVRQAVGDVVGDTISWVQRVLGAAYAAEQRIAATGKAASGGGMAAMAVVPALNDVRAQLAGLIHKGFVTETGWQRLPDLVRYLQGIEKRLEKLPAGAQRDGQMLKQLAEVQKEYQWLLANQRPGRPAAAEIADVRWMIEELRINYYAPSLGTPSPVSDVRIFRAMDAIQP